MEEYKVINIDTLDNSIKPVTLKQYTLINDETNNKKFLVLKLKNNETSNLEAIEVEITELDKNNKPLKHRTYLLDELNVSSDKYYIPFGKFIVDNETVKVEYKLIKATYNEQIWESGNWKNNSNLKEVTDKKVPTNTISLKPKKNIFVILIPILIALTLFFLLTTNVNAYFDNVVGSNIFSYTETNNNTIIITKYNGKDRDVVIPKRYNGLIVEAVGDYVFQGTNIKSVFFAGDNITIGSYAFADNPNLKSVSGSSIKHVGRYSFYNATNLNTFKFTDVGEFDIGVFIGVKKLKKLEIANIDDTYFQFGALQESGLNGLLVYGNFVILNKVLVSVNSSERKIELTRGLAIDKISKHAFRNAGNKVSFLTIDVVGLEIEKDLFIHLTALERIVISPEVIAPNDLFHYINNYIDHLEMPVIGDSFGDLFLNKSVVINYLVLHSKKPLSDEYTKDFPNIGELVIIN